MSRRLAALSALVVGVACGPARGGFVDYYDKDTWLAAVGQISTLDFTGFPGGTFLTDEYIELGVLFDGSDTVVGPGGAFPNDGWGLDGNGNIVLEFTSPQAWIGVDFPGHLEIDLYREGVLIYSSGLFGFGGGVGNFGGIVSGELFDRAILMDVPIDFEAEVDDIFFGVPSPGVLPFLGLAGLASAGRRRR